MGVGQAQEILTLLRECMQVLDGVTATTDKVIASTPNLEQHELSLRKEVHTMNMLMMTFQQFTGGDATVNAVINEVQKIMMLMMRLKLIILALESASGPWGWLYAGANIAAFGVALGNMGQ